VALLRQHAPAWALRLRDVLSADEQEALERRAAATAPQGALRTQAVALEALSTLAPLILILEDLHWCDHSTLDILARVAWREEQAHLLILCTYRPVDLIIQRHPLHEVKHELVSHGRGRASRHTAGLPRARPAPRTCTRSTPKASWIRRTCAAFKTRCGRSSASSSRAPAEQRRRSHHPTASLI